MRLIIYKSSRMEAVSLVSLTDLVRRVDTCASRTSRRVQRIIPHSALTFGSTSLSRYLQVADECKAVGYGSQMRSRSENCGVKSIENLTR